VIVRRASSTLTLVPASAPLASREAPAADRAFEALDWQGAVRLASDRASGISAPRWQQHVRAGLLERALSLGADHREGPHASRPEVGRRLLAHIDALAEAGLSFVGLQAFSEEAELDNPGALWTLTLLFGCLDLGDADEAFASWIASLDEALFFTYRGVLEIAEALALQPNPRIRAGAASWLGGSSAVLAAIALETMSFEQLSEDAVLRLDRRDDPLVHAAMARLLTRSPEAAQRPRSRRASWMDLRAPALAYEVARARILARDRDLDLDLDPLLRLRQRDPRAIGALGAYAMDVLALAGDESDGDLARELALGSSTTPGLLDAMGRAGLPSLFPRLLAALEDDDVEDEAHAALCTALGSQIARPSRSAWEQVIAALPGAQGSSSRRLRGGEPYTLTTVLEEMRRAELSAPDLRARADELVVRSGKPFQVDWDALGASLAGALSELSRLAR
jgi:hypothetical protein